MYFERTLRPLFGLGSKEGVEETGRPVSRLLQYSRGEALMVWIRLETVNKVRIPQIMLIVENNKAMRVS